ncbi:MAG: alpha-E domain-containing protein [Lachnospiraceae bacterium]|nr:alpha-E domain-containing protein [Lachnospiraceae bacterium]
MGIISLEKSDHLFWLGRYAERVFTTLDSFFRYFDRMLDMDDAEVAYQSFCKELSIPNSYKDQEDFIHKYLFSQNDPNSVYSNMLRAFDNAVVLRDELSSKTLSYIQLALDSIERAEDSQALVYDLQPVLDDLFAFWGCLDDNVEDEECRNIIKCGKYLERLDLYMRLGYPYRSIEKEYNKFLNRLHKIRIGYNLSEVDKLSEIINLGDDWRSRYQEALLALCNIF